MRSPIEPLQTVILAGGLGSRMNGYAGACPKALIPVAGQPLIEHVLAVFGRCGYRDFLVATGHQHEMIHDYFDKEGRARGSAAPFGGRGRNVQCIYTGADTQTAGRVKRLQPFLRGNTFMLTWTDGVADIDLNALVTFHRSHGRMATLTAVRPPPRFGHLTIGSNGVVETFEEKPEAREGWINGAFFVLETRILDGIGGDSTEFERGVLVKLANERELMAFQHTGLWRCADTPADIRGLEAMVRQPAFMDA
jgi:glucose-1-phosphate cytidylyltransferase